MMPTPAPAPPMPMQAMPAPMYFAASESMRKLLFEVCWRSVTGVNGVVEIDAGEDGEHIGLQEGDQHLERGDRHHETERQHGAEPAGDAEAAQHGDEAAEHFQRDVAGQHV